MVAGATGIDLFLLVIDAAEGARPQTHEHLAILRLLGVERGVVAVTKADLVDEETLEIALEEARELVPGAEVVAVSAKTGDGPRRAAGGARPGRPTSCPSAPPTGPRGSTSTASSRSAGSAPSSPGRSGRARSPRATRCASRRAAARCGCAAVQVHDRRCRARAPGERVALALPGIERRELHRGDALVTPGAFPVSYRLDVELEELARSTTAPGSRCTTARRGSPPGSPAIGERAAQLRLEAPVVAARGDRVVLRGETTLGGATVLDPAPPRRLEEERIALLERGDPTSIVAATVHAPVSVEALASRGLLSPAELDEGLAAVLQAGGWAFSREWLDETSQSVAERLRARAEASPLEPGLAVAELLPAEPWAPAILPLLPVERRGAIAYLPGVAASLGTRAEAAEALCSELEAGGLAAVKPDDPELARFLEARGDLVRLGDGFVVSAAAYERARELVVDRVRRRPARSRLPASATSRVSAAVTRSSCSSDSTRTASRAASATAGCCAGAPRTARRAGDWLASRRDRRARTTG